MNTDRLPLRHAFFALHQQRLDERAADAAAASEALPVLVLPTEAEIADRAAAGEVHALEPDPVLETESDSVAAQDEIASPAEVEAVALEEALQAERDRVAADALAATEDTEPPPGSPEAAPDASQPDAEAEAAKDALPVE